MTIRRRRISVADGDVGITMLELGDPSARPRLAILGGVHGDEPQGVAGAHALAQRLADRTVNGSVRIVPVSHEAAFGRATRTSPIDGRNLARTFPGADGGEATEQLAALIDEHVLADVDILIDLHSAGIHYAMPLLVGYADDGSPAAAEAARLAEAAATPVIWRHPGPLAPGRTGSGPQARGAPFLYLESTDDRDESAAYADAVLRVMAAAGMLEGAPDPAPGTPRRLDGPGDLDVGGVVARRTGLLEVEVDLLERVEAGSVVARIRDPRDDTEEAVRSSGDGIVVMRRRTRSVAAGDLVIFLTGEVASER